MAIVYDVYIYRGSFSMQSIRDGAVKLKHGIAQSKKTMNDDDEAKTTKIMSKNELKIANDR